MKTVINYMTSRECRSYLEQGGDLVLVPVGTVERLGPHLPLGARNIVVSAIAQLLAEKNNGITLPTIPYSTVYDAYKQQGSVDIAPDFMHQYCYGLCQELEANGFKRIVFVSFLEELYYLSHEYFQQCNLAVAYLTPNSYFDNSPTAAGLDIHGREMWRLVGCLSATGNDEMLMRVLAKTQEFFHAYPVVVNQRKQNLDLLGTTGHMMEDGQWQFYPVNLGRGLEDASVPFSMPATSVIEKAKEELLSWVDSLSTGLAGLSVYQDYLNKHEFKRPI